MLDKTLTLLTALLALLLLSIAARWLIDPSGTAQSFGFVLGDGLGRSTQIGDLAAFFSVAGGAALFGLFKRLAPYLYTAAALVGLTAIFRTAAWAAHDAAFASQAIIIEVITFVVFLWAGYLRR